MEGDNEEGLLNEAAEQTRDWLDLKARAYRMDPSLLQAPEMAELYARREQVMPDDDQLRLLLHSGLVANGPVWFWLQEVPYTRVL